MTDDGVSYFADQLRRVVFEAERASDPKLRAALFMVAAEYHRLALSEGTPGFHRDPTPGFQRDPQRESRAERLARR